MGFDVGNVPYNPDGWGPSGTLLSPLAPATDPKSHVPFLPFSRSERVGRVADWNRNGHRPSGNDDVFDFSFDDSPAGAEEGDAFRLVETKVQPVRDNWRRRPWFRQGPQLPVRKDEEVELKKKEAEKARVRRDKNFGNRGRQYFNNQGRGPQQSASLKPSVDIQAEWAMLEQIPFPTFGKLSFAVPAPPEDLLMCGTLSFYDRSFDRVNPKAERRLDRVKSRPNSYSVTTTDDPVIRRLAADDKATVFATDAILAALMCLRTSVQSWDIVVQRVGNKLFFDKRDGAQLDMLTVNETAQEPLPDAKDDINSVHSLSGEATSINQRFSQQVLLKNGEKVTFEEPNPFAAENDQEVAYRYRRWKLDDNISLIARCELHAVAAGPGGARQYLRLNALNEFDSKVTGHEFDFRKKLETQPGAVFANELKNNGNKLARWTAQALLAGVDTMKIGYVSRCHPRDTVNHVILGVSGLQPNNLVKQINMDLSNMWGIVKSIIDLCMKLGDGKYVLVKDPHKPQLRLYEVPADAFENDYLEEPLPEEEQMRPLGEVDDAAAAMDAVAEAEANAGSVLAI